MELVTIIIPAYNAEKTITQCLESVLCQTYSKLEVLVINDGSIDRTMQICAKYEQKDSRVKIFDQENRGVSAARNKGIEYAVGKYLCFLDADDYLEDTYIERMCQIYKESPLSDIVVCGYDEVLGSEQVVPELSGKDEMGQIDFLREIFEPYGIKGFLFNKLFKTEIIKSHGLFLNEEIYICEDLLFCCQYGQYVEYASFIRDPLYHYVMTGGSATRGEYNTRRFSSVYAFEKMRQITKIFQDDELNKNVDRHYIVICIQLFKRLLKKNKNFSGNEMRKILTVIRTTKADFLKSNWWLKLKLAYIPIKAVSMILVKYESVE